jgi:hypothetical protein
MITEATRQALIQDALRARNNIPFGVGLMLAGAAIAAVFWKVWLGLVLTILFGGAGLMMIPFGIAVLAQSARTISTSRRGVRELEASSLPVARIQK